MSNNAETTKAPLTLDFEEFEPFDATVMTKITTTKKLSELLNERLKAVFQDYYGCRIEPYPNGQGLAVTLVFSQLQHGMINPSKPIAFEPIGTDNSKSIAERSRMINNMYNHGRRYSITEDAKSALCDLFTKPDRVDWNKCTSESYSRPNAWSQTAYNIITGLDVNKVCEIIFGAAKGNGKDKMYYYPMVCAPTMNTNVSQGLTNWVVNLSLMTENSAKAMMEDVGLVGGFDGINCVTA